MNKKNNGFLNTIEEWRKQLTLNIALKNPKLDEHQMNLLIVKLINSVIFLRACEYKGVEQNGILIDILESNYCYNELLKLFQNSYKKYGLDLFLFETLLDSELNTKIEIDDKVLRKFIKSLYIHNSSSEHLINSWDVLGKIYERFIGKTISIDDTQHKVKVKLNQKARKTDGVYYTPDFIVKYIVKNTIGDLIKDKTPERISNIKILDPACGVGSFLIEAYQFLLDWHLNYYLSNDSINALKKQRVAKLIESDTGFQLTFSERKRILQNNIFGVDLDKSAVEITRLTLLLKLLDDTSSVSYPLPDLKSNIKCGNTLISSDILNNKSLTNSELIKLNPFDWDTEFKNIIDKGGFDCVIGNPPYVDSEEMSKTQSYLRNYASNGRFVTAKGNWDLYCIFTEKAISLLKDGGSFGFIVPNKFISLPYGIHLKDYLSNYHIKEILDYSSINIFNKRKARADVYPVVLIVNKNTESNSGIFKKISESNEQKEIPFTKNIIIKKGCVSWAEKLDVYSDLIYELKSRCKPISDYVNIESPATVSEAYEVKKLILNGNENDKNHFRFINTGTIDRYIDLWGLKKTTYIKDTYLKPVIRKDVLLKKFKRRYNQSKSKKLILAGMVQNIEAFYDDEGRYYAGKSTVIIKKSEGHHDLDLRVMLAIVNSNVFNILFRAMNKYNSMSNGYLNVNKNNIKDIPVPYVDIVTENNLCSLVDRISELIREFYFKKINTKKISYEKDIIATNNQINNIVYELYGLKLYLKYPNLPFPS